VHQAANQRLPACWDGLAGRRTAEELARTFLACSFKAFKATGQMHEKYNCEVPGGVGSGGEYRPQVGFGWTNGVALDLLWQYRHTLASCTGAEFS
jgi:alpha,alpha-trehalase